LKARVKELGLGDKIRVSRAGCLDSCAEGPIALLMPDKVMFKRIEEKDLEKIIEVLKG